MSDIDDEVRNFARLLASRRGSSGHQPAPVVEVSESSFDPEKVDIGFNAPPRSEPVPPSGGGGGILPPPPPPEGACCYDDGFCEILSPTDCTTFGGLYQGNGTPCSPNPCVGACCSGHGSRECGLTGPATCDGSFLGLGTNCSPNPCAGGEETDLCCINQVCYYFDATTCEERGGTVVSGVGCVPSPCPAACCIAGVCSEITQEECEFAGGNYKGGFCAPTTCVGSPCQCCCTKSGGTEFDHYCYVSNLAGCPHVQGSYLCEWCNYDYCIGPAGHSTCEPGGACCVNETIPDDPPGVTHDYCFQILIGFCDCGTLNTPPGYTCNSAQYCGNYRQCGSTPPYYTCPGCVRHETLAMGLGDVVSAVATPIAGMLNMDCVDPETQQLRPGSPCDKRRQSLNDLSDAFFDAFWPTKKEETDAVRSNETDRS